MDTSTADLISNLLNLRSSIIRSSKASVDQLLAVLLKKIISILVGTSRDLDQLCKAVADLCYRKTAEESEVKECVRWGMIGTKAVLVAAVVDGDFDGDRGIDEADDCGGDADVVGVATIGSTSEAVWSVKMFTAVYEETYPATSVTRPPPTTRTGSFR